MNCIGCGMELLNREDRDKVIPKDKSVWKCPVCFKLTLKDADTRISV